MKVPAFHGAAKLCMERMKVPRPGTNALTSRRMQEGGGAASLPSQQDERGPPSAPARREIYSPTGDRL